jgi:hypothetical protein
MKKSSLWAIYCRKYPQFAQDGEITLTTKGLRKFFDTTWDTAYYDGEPEEEITCARELESEAINHLRNIFKI